MKTLQEKKEIMLREANFVKGLIHGSNLLESMKAFSVMKKYHADTFRKDGLGYDTHPVRVTHQLLATGIKNDSIIAAALLHDVIEDCSVSETQLRNDYGFSDETMTILTFVTKKKNYNEETYYRNIASNPGAILVKISDRLHNLSTMHGAFSQEKMLSYVEETYTHILPLCRILKYEFPEYANASYIIKNQIETICEIYSSLLTK